MIDTVCAAGSNYLKLHQIRKQEEWNQQDSRHIMEDKKSTDHIKRQSISFDNTEIAFNSKSDKALKQSYLLFSLLNNNLLVKIGPFFTTLAMKLKLPVKPLIKSTIFAQFCGGETIQESVKVADDLGMFNVSSILDYSVEADDEEEMFDLTMQEIIRTIKAAADNTHIPFSVFKISGLARNELLAKVQAGSLLDTVEKAQYQRTGERVNEICRIAYNLHVPVMIDAEETWIQQPIDDFAISMMEKYNKESAIVFNTIQLYRHDRLAWLKTKYDYSKTADFFLGVKLVRGAYMEKERARAKSMNYASPIQPDKKATDADYNEALSFCMENADRISLVAGTHNQESCELLVRLLESKHLPENYPHIWFSQLLGMSDNLSFNLAASGYNVAKYLPYGPIASVMPYLFRRAEENTAIAGQMSRELGLLIREKERRKI